MAWQQRLLGDKRPVTPWELQRCRGLVRCVAWDAPRPAAPGMLCPRSACRQSPDTRQTSTNPSSDKDPTVILATSYPFLEVVWTMLVFFAFVVWIWILFTVLADIFRRHDTSAFSKLLWILVVIIIPYFGVFIYLIAEHDGMTERTISQQKAAQSQFDSYVQSVAAQGDPTEQISKAKQLLDSGTITQAEFDQIKQKALAGS